MKKVNMAYLLIDIHRKMMSLKMSPNPRKKQKIGKDLAFN